jgi:TonB family protein
MSKLRMRLLVPGLAVGLSACLAWWVYSSARLLRGAAMPLPENGTVTSDRYTNTYFDLSYAVPQGLIPGLAGPEPSETGYYALASLVPAREQDGAILIAAQDMFFSPDPRDDVAAEARDLRDAMARIDGMTIDQEPLETTIAGHLMQRVDFSGVGLYRATFVTEIRCHFVSFNLTARTPELLSKLAKSVKHISHSAATDADSPVPLCVKDYAVAENLLKRVEPTFAAPGSRSVPVRIVIDSDGDVKHIHVVHGSDEQRRSAEQALRQWKFKPPRVDGKAVEIETGIMFRPDPAQKS